jgi:glycosyltransferase involved in cell wall biosynthesis
MKNELRIGIDGRALQGRLSGIGRYIFELCKELDKLMPNARFFIYSQYPVEMPVLSERWVSRVDSSSIKHFLKSAVWLKLRCGSLCREDELDYFWASATLLPRLQANVRIISTVYDLNHLIVPETMATPTLWSYRLFFNRDVKKADVVTAISDGTSKRLFDYLGVTTSAIVRPAASSLYKPQMPLNIKRCEERYSIMSPYILSVATWEPRKNLELLIDTYTNMKAEGLIPLHKLVLVGGKGWKDARLLDIISQNPSGDVIALGYVPEIDLPLLYAGADIFVFPSIYEGFGMPVLEARLCGTQVVTTDIPELREAGGVGVIYITASGEGIRDGILLALSQSHQRRASNEDCEPPTWQMGAEKLADIFLVM